MGRVARPPERRPVADGPLRLQPSRAVRHRLLGPGRRRLRLLRRRGGRRVGAEPRPSRRGRSHARVSREAPGLAARAGVRRTHLEARRLEAAVRGPDRRGGNGRRRAPAVRRRGPAGGDPGQPADPGRRDAVPERERPQRVVDPRPRPALDAGGGSVPRAALRHRRRRPALRSRVPGHARLGCSFEAPGRPGAGVGVRRARVLPAHDAHAREPRLRLRPPRDPGVPRRPARARRAAPREPRLRRQHGAPRSAALPRRASAGPRAPRAAAAAGGRRPVALSRSAGGSGARRGVRRLGAPDPRQQPGEHAAARRLALVPAGHAGLPPPRPPARVLARGVPPGVRGAVRGPAAGRSAPRGSARAPPRSRSAPRGPARPAGSRRPRPGRDGPGARPARGARRPPRPRAPSRSSGASAGS